jgi:hypothetical protein
MGCYSNSTRWYHWFYLWIIGDNMTTPFDIVTRAMKDIGALAAGEDTTA